MNISHSILIHLADNPDFINQKEVREYLNDDEVSMNEWIHELHEAVDCATEGLWESATEQFHSQVGRWMDHRDYLNHDIPAGVDSDSFAQLVAGRVIDRLKDQSCH